MNLRDKIAMDSEVKIEIISAPIEAQSHVHRWAWLVSGEQACGYCGVYRER